MKRSRLLNTKLVENINVPKLPDVIILDTHEDISKIFFEEGDLLDAKSIADRLATVVNVSETVGKTLWDMKNTYDTKMREMEKTVKDAAEIAEDAQDYIDSQISDVKRNITGLDDALEGINQTLIGVDININNIEGAIIDINSNLNNYATIASLNLHIQELTETDEELREEIEKLKNSSTGPGGNITLDDYVKIEDYNKAIGDINLRIDGVNDRIISIEEQISTFPSTYATREWVVDKISELGVIQPGEGTKFAIRYQGGTQYAPTINDRGYKTVTNSQVLAETYGWTVTEPASYEHLWAIEATFNLDGTLVGTWSDPIRRTGIQGPIGITPNSFFVSTVFLRSNDKPNKPVGGSYDKPVPDGWWDGVPSGDEILWASSRTFSSDGEDPQDKEWSTPAQMTDTANFNVEFSELKVYVKPSDRNGHTEESWHEINKTWSNTANENTIWMATCTYSNGVWSSWLVSKIKGENGNDGTSIDIKKGAKIVPTEADLKSLTAVEGDVCFVGSVTDMENVKLWIYKSGEWVLKTDNVTGDAYLVGEYIFVYDGDSWVKSAFKGDPGLPAFVHIKYGNSTVTGDWTNRNGLAVENPIPEKYKSIWGETPGAYIGITSDNNGDGPLDWGTYTWTKWQGEDGFGYEYIYQATTDYSAPACPKSENIDDDVPERWFDNPVTVTRETPYCWVCHRKKANGVWGNYRGSNTNPSYAALYTRFPVEVLDMNASFTSFVFTRNSEKPNTPTGGKYTNPIPNEAIWSDGIPTGEEILWCSTRIFSSDEKYPQQSSWTEPKQMTDTADFDVEFSSEETPSDPSGHPNTNTQWSNKSDSTTIWMATSTCKNGEWTEWQVSKIKGEKGNDGTSISIKKGAKIVPDEDDLSSISNPAIGDECFVGDVNNMKYVTLWIYRNGEWIEKPKEEITIGDAYLVDEWLFVWGGDSWVKSQFKGDPGTPAYIHIKYANSNTPGDWTNRGGHDMSVEIPSGSEYTGWGEAAGPWLGIWSDNTVDDPANWYTYRWTKCEGQDGFGYEYIFTRTEDYVAPDVPTPEDDAEEEEWATTDEIHPYPWSDDNIGVTEDHKYCWVCYRMKKNGRWTPFQGTGSNKSKAALYAKWASDGIDGIGKDANNAFKSTVFTRTNITPDTPKPDVTTINNIEYNTYDNPIPGDVNGENELIWSDGIPAGDAILWASTRIFSNDGQKPQQDTWTEPKKMTDTSDFDIAYSRQIALDSEHAKPKSHGDHTDEETFKDANGVDIPYWENTANEKTIWMATSTCKNGEWSDWKVSKIKGEKGDDGTSIKIKGTKNSVDELPIPPDDPSDCYIIGQNLYVWDGDSWVDAGPFKGDKGDTAYIHIKYANQDNIGGTEVILNDGTKVKLSFTENSGKDPGLYMGIKADYTSTPSSDISDYTWTRWRGEDGFGYEYIYCRTTNDVPPEVPVKSVYGWTDEDYQKNDFVPTDRTGNLVWTDDPQDVNKDNPYCWMCHRQKVDGVWQDFKGSATNEGFASVWTRWGRDGENATIYVLDFDNDFDDITYNEFGAPKYENRAVTSTARLYKNGEITSFGYDNYLISDSGPWNDGAEYELIDGALKVTVTDIPEGASSRNITVGVTLDGVNYYYDTFTVRRLVNEDGYKLVCTPNIIVDNVSDGTETHYINIEVYKKVNGGAIKVDVPSGYNIYYAEGNNSFNKNNIVSNGVYGFDSDSSANVIKFILSNDTTNWSFLDYVDIPVARVYNGESTTTVEKNPIIYPAGKWDPEKNYIMSENAAGIATTPYVLHNECYWVLIASKSDFAEPVEDSSVWLKFEMYEAVYSDIGVFKQALVGQAVFYKDYMYSQDGILSKKVKDVAEDDSVEINQYSEESDMYELFDPNDPHATNIQYIEEDFRFSTTLGVPTNPNVDPTGWHETVTEDPTWVAYRTRLYGTSTWSDWVVKGFVEWDEPVGGILSDKSQLPSLGSEDYGYIIGKSLYMWNGTTWVDVGDFEIVLVDDNLSKNSKFTPNTYINLKTGEIYSRKSKFDDAELDNAVCTRLSVVDGFLLHHLEYGYNGYPDAIGNSSIDNKYVVLPNLDQISNKLLVINSRSDWDKILSIPLALEIKLPKPATDGSSSALRYLYQTKYIGNKVCIVNNTHQYIRNEMLLIHEAGGSLDDHVDEYTGMDIIKISNVLYEEFISSDPNVLPPNYLSDVILMPGLCLMAELKMKYIPNEKSITGVENSENLYDYGLSRYSVLGYHVYESTTDPLYRGQATPYFYWAFTIFDLSDRTTLKDGDAYEYFNALAFSENIINGDLS